MTNLQKRKRLIHKLFKVVAKETVGTNPSMPVRLKIKLNGSGVSCCGWRTDKRGIDYILVEVDLKGLLYQVKYGYSSAYYKDRPDRLNKYIIKNRHNALRFILWHEARHAYQRLDQKFFEVCKHNREIRERDADSWALAHFLTRPQDRKTRPQPKVAEYIRLYKSGSSTAKIASLCQVKDPRSIRYYLSKAGINLRRR